MHSEAQPPIIPNLLVDFNFNNSLYADYKKNGTSLVLAPSDAGAVILSEDYVTINPSQKYLESTSVLLNYLKNTGDQSWIIQFRLLTNNGGVRLALTTSPAGTTSTDFTGFSLFIINENILVEYFKGVGESLVYVNYLITSPNVDLSVGIHQIVTTYNESTRTLKLYFDDRPVVTEIGSAGTIFYSADSKLVLNKLGTIGTEEIAEYHRVASYDKVFTDSEVLSMYNQIIQDADKNPTYTFQITSNYGDPFIMPWEVKAFNLNDVRINLQDTYTVIIPHNGHESQSGYDLTRLFDYNDGFSSVWWNTETDGPHPITIYVGDQLFSVTIPSLPGDTLIDRQVKYVEITWDQDTRAPGLLILRNGVMVYDDGDVNNGSTRQFFTKKYDLSLPGFIPPGPPPPPPPPPLIPTIPDMHWNFETFYDNINAVEFTNPFDIQIVDEKVVIDQAGPNYYLKANIPIELVSPFSKTLMFRFKSLRGFSEVVNFAFSTYEGDIRERHGILVRIIYDNILGFG
jgi:hypothetical protein